MNAITREAYEGDIVSRLRNWRGLHLAHGGELFEQAADEIERLRLTDAEREAVEVIVSGCSDAQEYSVASNAVKIVRGLLERTK